MTGVSDRQTRIRARAAALAERDAALPAALCGACGALVRRGDGVAYPRPSWGYHGAQTDAVREGGGLPPLREWTRRHDACATTPGIVRALLGVDLSPEVAGAAIAEASRVRGADILAQHRAPDAARADLAHQDRKPRPWAHLDDADLARLTRAVDRARAQVEPRRCTSGACAWCGVSRSVGWRSSPEVWSDGSAAPFCSSCASVWESRRRPTEHDELRAAAFGALTGEASWGSHGLLTFCDVAGEDHAGTAEPWQYAPEALAALREDASPEGAQRRRDAMEAAQAAEDAKAEAEARTAARAAGWPV